MAINLISYYTGLYKANDYELLLPFGVKSLNVALTANLSNTSNCSCFKTFC